MTTMSSSDVRMSVIHDYGNIEYIKSLLLARWYEKMAIILPRGQWYAPSAVINDAQYCTVLHGIAGYSMVLQGMAWYCIVLH